MTEVSNPYELAAIINTLLTALLGGFILLKGNRASTRLFGIYTLAIALWSGCFYFMISSRSPDTSVFWARLLHVPGSLIPATFLHFTQTFLEVDRRPFQRAIRRSAYCIGGILIPASFTKQFVASAVREPGFPHFYMGPGPYYHVFVLFFMSTIVAIHIQMALAYREETPFRKLQILYLFASYAIGYAGGVAVFLPYYGLRLPAVALYSIPACHLAITFSILRYRFLDVGLIIRWSIAYGISIIAAASVFLVGVWIFEQVGPHFLKLSQGIPTVIMACVVVLIFQPAKFSITKWVDRFIFKSPDFRNVISGIENTLRDARSINPLCVNLVEKFRAIWKINHAGLAIWSPTNVVFKLYPEGIFEKEIITAMRQYIDQTDFLVRTLESERRLFVDGIVIDEELLSLTKRVSAGERTTFSKIRRSMRWLGAAVCVPLAIDGTLIGFIILGPKKAALFYNEEDKKFLAHVSQLIAPTIRNFVINGNEL